jgi:hypothetical protein
VARVPDNVNASHLLFARAEAARKLIEDRLSFQQVLLFHRPISLSAPKATKFPCCFVQPERWEPSLATNVKYEFWAELGLYVYHVGNDPSAVGQEVEITVSKLDKLFSNNALDDRTTATPTYQFFQYPGFWLMSRFGPVTVSPVLSYMRDNTERYLVGAKASLRVFDALIHT